MIPAIPALGGGLPLADAHLAVQAAAAGDAARSGASGAASGAAFQVSLGAAVDNLQALQSTSNELAIRAVTGDLQDIHAATIAATQAQVTLELVAAVRNKGVEAFNEIMRMQA